MRDLVSTPKPGVDTGDQVGRNPLQPVVAKGHKDGTGQVQLRRHFIQVAPTFVEPGDRITLTDRARLSQQLCLQIDLSHRHSGTSCPRRTIALSAAHRARAAPVDGDWSNLQATRRDQLMSGILRIRHERSPSPH